MSKKCLLALGRVNIGNANARARIIRRSCPSSCHDMSSTASLNASQPSDLTSKLLCQATGSSHPEAAAEPKRLSKIPSSKFAALGRQSLPRGADRIESNILLECTPSSTRRRGSLARKSQWQETPGCSSSEHELRSVDTMVRVIWCFC